VYINKNELKEIIPLMEILPKLKQIQKTFFEKSLDLFNAAEKRGLTEEERLGYSTAWFWNPHRGLARNINLIELRQFAHSPVVQMCEQAIIQRVCNTPTEFFCTDPERSIEEFSVQIQKIDQFLDYPNRNLNESFDSLTRRVLKDLLEIDSGVFHLGRDSSGRVSELFALDGGTVLKEKDVHNILIQYHQYSWSGSPKPAKTLAKEDIGYIELNPSNYSPYGFSPLQSAQREVEVMIQSSRFNRDLFAQNAIPDGIVSVDTSKEQYQRIKSQWMRELVGKAHKLAFWNAKTASFIDLRKSHKDMEWLEGQKWYLHKIFGAFGVSPATRGFFQDVGARSTQGGQERVTVTGSMVPYFKGIEGFVNRQLIPAILGEEHLPLDKRTPLGWRYAPPDHEAKRVEHEQDLREVQLGTMTVDEFREKRGRPPLSEEDRELANGPNPGKKDTDEDADEGAERERKQEEKQEKRAKSREAVQQKKLVSVVAKSIDAGGEVVDESEDYETFYVKQLAAWETKMLKAAELIVQKSLTKKSFTEFVSRLFSSINTTNFAESLQRIVARTMKRGLQSSEEELDMDIGVTQSFEQKSKFFADQQLNGYRLPSGEKWHGIQGASKKLQTKILKEVETGVKEGEGIPQIQKRISSVFDSAKKGQAVMIARTESNRFVNEGKLVGYAESGVEGRKEWSSASDCCAGTGDACETLHGQSVSLSDSFETRDGKSFNVPPAHPNCRCTIKFRPEGV